jgi:anthranilate phosphoribosyltransferase
LRSLGVRRALVAHGASGLDELSTLGRSYVGELTDGAIRHYELHPETLGLRRAVIDQIRAQSPQESAKLALQLLKNELNDEHYEMVLLNAGAGIYVGQGAGSLEAGMAKAEDSIQSGAASDKLQMLIERMRAPSHGPSRSLSPSHDSTD